ncbi:unnamed protein product [Parnassius apollo]|uniref:(apollo) hypothetical protein n=1 Tax=Parnassius apollo TaxID=110799 RepID=A0A8S3YCD2_PARAO|nr:unnamed protein product [Parnassius apollo]
MAYLNDDDIENELEQMFGFLDNPDESEDEYEGEDSLEIGLGIRAMSEDPNIIQNQGNPVPGPSRRSPVSFLSSSDGEMRENIDPNIGVPNIETILFESIVFISNPTDSTTFLVRCSYRNLNIPCRRTCDS